MLRLFIAVFVPLEALHACAAEARRIDEALGSARHAVKFVREEGVHFTLKFLGHVPEDQRSAIEEGLARAAAEHGSFDVELAGLQAFPSPRRPRVIYLGVTAGAAPMIALASSVEKHIAPLGFPSEKRPFTPHLTLARVKDPKASARVGDRVAKLAPREVARFTADRIHLVRSELHPSGSRYTSLASFPLVSQGGVGSPAPL